MARMLLLASLDSFIEVVGYFDDLSCYSCHTVDFDGLDLPKCAPRYFLLRLRIP